MRNAAPSPGASRVSSYYAHSASSMDMSSPVTPPVVAGTRRLRPGMRGQRQVHQAIPTLGRVKRPPVENGRKMFQDFVAASHGSGGLYQQKLKPQTADIAPQSTYFPSAAQRHHRQTPAANRDAEVRVGMSKPKPQSIPSPSLVSLEGHQSFHEVEPRRSIPMPFTLDGHPMPPSAQSRKEIPTANLDDGADSGRSTSHLLAFGRELRFPATLSILWDRTPLRTPVIIPHERLLPSLWVSSHTAQALSMAALQYRQDKEASKQMQPEQAPSSGPGARPVGLLIGRATFPARRNPDIDADSDAATFLGESRPIICVDLFDTGVPDEDKAAGSSCLLPTNSSINDVGGVVIIPVEMGTCRPRSKNIHPSSSNSSWVSLGTGGVTSHVLGLAQACSHGGEDGKIPIGSGNSIPGAGLWHIQCAVALQSGNEDSEPDEMAQLQVRMCLPAISLSFTLIESLPLLQTPLASMLLHPASCNSDTTTDATTTDMLLPRHGLLTLNQVRRVVPLLSDDPAAVGPNRLPMVGAWIRMPFNVDTIQQVPTIRGRVSQTSLLAPRSAAIYEPASPEMHRILTDPAVWAACCQYLYNPRLLRVTGVEGITGAFLLCIFPEDPVRPGSPRNPIFLECSTVNDAIALGSPSLASETTRSSAFQQAEDDRPCMPIEMFEFSTCFPTIVDRTGSSSTPGFDRKKLFGQRVADTMVSCRFHPLSSNDSAAQKELADALDICTAQIAVDLVDDLVDREEPQNVPNWAGLCSVRPVAATLAAISDGCDLEVEGEEGEEVEEEEEEGEEEEEEEIYERQLQIQGGDFSVEFEDYEGFVCDNMSDDGIVEENNQQVSFDGLASNDSDSENENIDRPEIDDCDSPAGILWHHGRGTPRTSMEITRQTKSSIKGSGNDEETIVPSQVSESKANGTGPSSSITLENTNSGPEIQGIGPKLVPSLPPHGSATAAFISRSILPTRSSFQHEDTMKQKQIQSSLTAQSLIASQQLEIRMLREQVEKLTKIVERISLQKSLHVNANDQQVNETKQSRADVMNEACGGHINQKQTPEVDAVSETGAKKDDMEMTSSKTDVIHDQSPIDPFMRLSIPSYAEDEDTVDESKTGNLTRSNAKEEEPKIVNSFVNIPRIVFDERYLTRGSSDDSEASFLDDRLDYSHSIREDHRKGSYTNAKDDETKKSEDEYDEGVVEGFSAKFASDPLLAMGADMTSYQESDTIARIEAKYLREGEKTAVMNGLSFVSQQDTSQKPNRQGRRQRRKSRRRLHGDDHRILSKTKKSTEDSNRMEAVLDRKRLLNMPKFDR